MPPRKERVARVCGHCGKTIYFLECQLKRGRGNYCSRACKYEGTRRKSEVECQTCGKRFMRHISEQDIGVRINQFCSKPCYFIWRQENMSKDSYPKGEGGVHMHRLVAEQYLGRPLSPEEVVHHLDENKHNFDPGNLAVLPDQKFHAQVHFGSVPDSELRKYHLLTLAEALA